MKRAFLFAITVLFLANTTIALAWNPPCMFGDGHAQAMTQADPADSLPDCHKAKTEQPQEQQPETHHCEGLCFCAQASSSPNFTLLANEPKPVEPAAAYSFPAATDFPASLKLVPPERPPNTFS